MSMPLASTAPLGCDGADCTSCHLSAVGSTSAASSRAPSEAAVPSEAEHHSEEASLVATVTPLQAPLTWRSSGLLLLVSLGTLAVVGQLVRKDAAVAQLASEVSVLQATVNKLLEAQAQTKQTTTVEAVAEIMAMKEEVQEMPTKEWVNEQLCKPQTWNLQKSIGFCFMVAMVVVLGTATYVIAMLNALKAQLKAMQTTVERTPNSFASYSLLAYFFA
mmetsp:Transcript_5209/g.11540  ORF Transcript_5209/g.11540 Transcript_5209/m.11540 type:complete len:218 (-) Transcript_5209:78-731(-)